MITIDKKPSDNGKEPLMQANLQLLPLIMNNIPQAVFWKDQNLVYLGCNQAFADDAGFSSPEEVVGKTDFDMPWKDQSELYRSDDQLVMKKGEPKLNYEEPQTTPSGSIIWLRTSKIPVYENDQIVAILGMYEDVTAQKQVELDLLLRDRALDSSLNAVIILNFSDNKPIYANKAVLKMTGYSFDEIQQLTLLDITGDPEELPKIRTAVQTQGFFIGEELIKRKDGSSFPATFFTSLIRDSQGQPIAIQSSFFDITDSKQAEETVHASEERFRRFTEATVEGMVFHEKGKIVDVNPAAIAMFGFTEATNLIGKNLFEFIAPESHELVVKQMQLDSVLPYEIQGIRQGGSIFPIETSTRAYKLGDQEIRASSIRDITERKQTETELRQSELRLSNAMLIAQMGYWDLDVDTQMFIFNDQYYRTFHATTTEEMGGNQMSVTDFIQRFVPPGEGAVIGTGMQEAIETKDPNFQVKLDARNLTVQGELRWVSVWLTVEKDEHGRTIKLHGVNQDITERKQVEADKLREKNIADATINSLPGIFYMFDAQGNLVRRNKNYETVAGYSAEEMATRNALDAVAEEDRQRTAQAIQRAFAEGKVELEVLFQTRHGKKIPYFMTAVRMAIGDDMYVVGTGLDLSERKRLEAQVQEAFERRGLQVQLSTQVSQSIAAATSLEDLYQRVVSQVKEQFGYYHTQLLRYDSNQNEVVLVTGYGKIGEKMLADGHRMPMGKGLIGTAAATGETVMRPVLENDPDWRANPILPETKGEIAVPIKLGNTILGVLDVQSDTAGALNTDDQLLLEGLCGQIAVAIESTRLQQEMTERLEEINRLYQAMSQEGWKAYRESADIPKVFIFDQNGVKQQVSDTELANELFTSFPLTITGGNTIGSLAVLDDSQHPLSPEDQEFVQLVSEQVSIAMESARLFEQTQDALQEAKDAELAVRASEAKLAEALEIARLANWEYDVEKDLFTFNDQFFSIFHTTAEEMGGYKLPSAVYAQRLVHPDDAHIVGAAIEKALASTDKHYSAQLEHRVIYADGGIGHLSVEIHIERDDQGKITRYYGANQDITERKLAEQIVAKRATELETVAKVSATTSTVLDPDKLLQTVVDITKERFGLYHAHIYLADEDEKTLFLAAGAGEIGKQMVANGWNIQLNHEQSIVATSARDKKPVVANDIVHEKDSTFLSNQLLPDTRSEIAVPMIVGEKVLGIFDVQSEKANYFSQEDVNIFTTLASQVAVALQNARLYVEQAATVTQLRELDRLKSAFLANMSHELRTPLNSILGFTDVMLEGLDGDLTDYMDNDLRLIQKNGRHLLHLINDVLDMAKIESGRMNLHPETFKVHDIFEEVTSITAPLASEKNVSLFIDEDSDQKIEVYADNTRLRQVMINLVNNSIKFTDQGKIALSVKPLDGARVLISVKDTGIGIPPDHLESVFQEFTQVDTTTTRKAGGTGLGLPISRRLIEMHGGRLWAESTGVDGEGSTFFVEMPVEAHIADVIEKQEK